MSTTSQHSKFVYKLLNISHLLENSTDLEDNLKELDTISAEILEAKRCSIMLISHDQKLADEENYIQVMKDTLLLLTEDCKYAIINHQSIV